MRRYTVLVLVVIMAFVMAMSPVAYAQQTTPTGTPTAADGAGATGTSTPEATTDTGTTGTGSDATTTPSGMTDKLPEVSGTVRQSFDLLGATVENTAGDRLGTLDNLLVIPSSGYIPFALIASGGIFGLGEKLIPVPFSALQYDAERGVFILDVAQDTLDEAPSLGRYASPNTRELLRNTELRDFWSQFDMSATGGLPGASETGTGTGATGTDTTGTMTDTLPSATMTPNADMTETSTPEADATGTSTPVAGATDTMTDTETTTGTDLGTTGAITDTGTLTDTTTTTGTATGGLVQVGSFGEQSLRSMGMAGQGEEDLVRLTELGDYSIVTDEANGTGTGTDLTGTATPEAGATTDTGTTGTVTPEATETVTSTTGTTDTGTGATGAMTDTTTTDTVTGATETITDTTTTGTGTDATGALTDTTTMTDTTGTDNVINLDAQANQIGRVEDLLIDVEAARVLYVLASMDLTQFDNRGTTGTDVTGTDTMTDTGALTDTLPSATTTPLPTLAAPGADVTGTPSVPEPETGTPTADATDTTSTPEAGATATDTGTTDTTGTGAAVTDTTGAGITRPAGGGLLLIPWQALELSLVDKQFRLLVPASALADAPFASDFAVPDFSQSGWDRDINGFWTTALAAVTSTPSTGATETGTTGTGVDTTTTITGTETMTDTTGTGTGTTGTGTRRAGRNIATESGVVMQASEITGTNVKDPMGTSLGDLTDLLFGSADGQIYYGVVSYGGFLGLGGRTVAVPWSAFRFDAENEDFVLDTTQETLDNAPALTTGEEGFGTPGWDAEIQDYWSGQGMETPDTTGTGTTGTGVAATATITGTETLTDTTGTSDTGLGDTGTITDTGTLTDTTGTTGTTATATQAGGQLLRVDRFVGANVNGTGDENLGEVSDLLVNLDAAQVLYAVVSYGGFLGIGANAVPVPWTAAQVQMTENGTPYMTLNADKAMLDNAPQLDLGSLPEDISAGWDASVRSYWEGLSNQ